MKPIIHIILIHILLFSTLTYAQVRVGGLAGINSTGLAGDAPKQSKFSSGMGYGVGVMAEINIQEDIAINLQPMYASRSASIEYEVPYQYEPFDSITINIDYFEIPLNIRVISDNNISFVTAGLVLALPLRTTARNNKSGSETDIKDQFQSYVLSAHFGVGIQFSIGEPVMFVEFGYRQSLTNLMKLTIDEVNLNNKLKSNGIQLNTGILFSL